MQRRFDPYGLVFRAGRWYVGGFCHLRQAWRSFRLDRLSAIAGTGDQFERPANFDAARHLQDSLHKSERRYPVRVLFHTDISSLTAYMTSTEICMNYFEDMLVQDDSGVLLTTSTDDFHWFVLWLAGLPFEFAIQSPDELKTAFSDHVQKLHLAV